MTGRRPGTEVLDTATFHAIANLAYQESGLTLVVEKAPMVQSRLRPRLRALGLSDFAQYAKLLHSNDGNSERRQLISALTTNVSHFFREEHHFETLTDLVRRLLPKLRAGAPLRIWSAGCSQGQEPLSIAMTLKERIPEVSKLDLRILATDIDPKVVAFSRAGLYPERMLARVPEAIRGKYFQPTQSDGSETHFVADRGLLDMIRHKELNLLSKWPIRARFDAIFCRNTVIYFDAKTQADLWPRFRTHLQPHGVLFLGHSERINDPRSFGFDCTGPTTYQLASSG